MSFHTWLALAVTAVTPVAASAQHDLSAHSSRETGFLVYQSAFAAYKGFAEDEETPDTRWRAVNEEVGRLGGHAAHLKGASAPPGQAMPANARPKADAAIDHSKHR